MGNCLTEGQTSQYGFDPPDEPSDADGYLTLNRISQIRPKEHANHAYTYNSDGDPDQTTIKRRLSSFVNEGQSRDAELQKMVEVFEPCIIETVKVTDILPHLHDFIEDEEAIKNKSSQREAARCLIGELKVSREYGRWQAFMDALRIGGYPYLVNLLNGHTEKDHSTQRKLVKLLKPELICSIDLDTCMDTLLQRDVLHEQDVQEIRCERERRGETAACLMLLDSIPRRSENWFEEFLSVLGDIGLGHMAETLELGNVYVIPPRRCKMQTASANGSSQVQSFQDVFRAAAKTPPRDVYPEEAKTPPPEYQDDHHTTEMKNNHDKIKRLSDKKLRKERQLEQRKTIAELQDSIRNLDEKLAMFTLADDSFSEPDMTREIKNAPPHNVLSPICANLDSDVTQDSEDQNSDISIGAFSSAIQEHTSDKLGVNIEELRTLIGAIHEKFEDMRTVICVCKEEQRSGFSELKGLINDYHDGTSKELTAFGQQLDALREKVEGLESEMHRLGEVCRPPQPHNMHPVDSAFSDCSVISITSF